MDVCGRRLGAHTCTCAEAPTDGRPRDGIDLIGAIKPGRLPCVHDIAAIAINKRLDFAEKPTSALPLAHADMQLPNRVDVAQGQEPEILAHTSTVGQGQFDHGPRSNATNATLLLLSLSSRFGDPAQSGLARAK
ncbi:unnamed protein product [Clonostachys byssicola]|uniref:Uncharacterized protein n=1 Tax=Clonostachys byssicola TaxID=160290 RepID=A0A9N9URM3_9HYPO|nr:unnamed protein product [Clonostachys byssicola]